MRASARRAGTVLLLMTAAVFTVSSPGSVTAAAEKGAAPASSAGSDLAARARKLQAEAIVVDTHEDVPDALGEKWADIAERGATLHFDIPRAREGGLTAPFFAVYVSSTFAEAGGAAKKTLEVIDLVGRVVASHPADLVPAASVSEIRKAKKDGKIAVLMGIEGGHAIEDSLPTLRQFHRLGIRYMTLTHVNTNHWADATGPFFLPDFDPAAARVHGGLTDFGREVVREMNRLGMAVDISHVSDDTMTDVFATSRAPVFASHSSCRALCDIPRNLTDDEIRQVASKGGVIMINIGSYFLDPETVAAQKAELAKIRPEYDRIKKEMAGDVKARDAAIGKLMKPMPRRRTQWTKVVDHIEHAMQVGGPGCVGLGTDFDGIQDPPEGLDDVSMLPKLTEELLRRGHSDAEVKGVLGENFLRFFSKVEETAARLRDEPASTATIEPVAGNTAPKGR